MLDCQVDLILRSLELYAHIYKFIYPRQGKAETKEENLRVCLVNDTYEQISNQFVKSKIENPVLSRGLDYDEKFFEKIA